MQFKRFFTTSEVKNTYKYIDTQKKYEIIRTLAYFGVSLSLFAAGYIATKSKTNVLTVVAILGCLPASKSLVSMIMFLRQKSCRDEVFRAVNSVSGSLEHLFDLVFTTEKVTYQIAHCVYHAKCLLFYSDQAVDVQGFTSHIEEYLKKTGISGVTVKVYTDLSKYCTRISQLTELEDHQLKLAQDVIQLLKEITL